MTHEPIKILATDGGGIRGIIPAIAGALPPHPHAGRMIDRLTHQLLLR
jgi:hypothetical protein